MTTQVETVSALPPEGSSIPPEGEPKKPKLPAGLTQEQVDEWKATYPRIAMARISGCYAVYRPLTRAEFLALRPDTLDGTALTDAILTQAVLWQEQRPATGSAGHRTGLSRAIADVSGVGKGYLYLVDEDLLQRWDKMMADYPKEERYDILPFVREHEALWVLITEERVYLLTYVTREDYDQVMENNPEAIEDRLIQHGVVHPRFNSAQLRALPYGLYQSLQNNLNVTCGFNPEPAVIL